MKKLSLFVIALFAVGFVMAQNTATVNQFGSNIGSVTQSGGDDNQATIQQGFLGAPVNNSHAPTHAGDWIEGSYIRQIGSTNTASTTVRTSANGTSINQEGNLNIATQDVGSTYERTTDLTKMGLDIDQLGSSNAATQKTISSFGSYGIQGMTILQQGNSNVADQVSIGGMAQIQRIKQVGNNNNNSTTNTFDLSTTTLANPLTALAYTFSRTTGGAAVVGLPMSQYSNQRFGSAIMNVTGSDNNTYQFQEYRVWSTSGDNDEILNLTGSRNDVAQGQLGEKNYSDIEMTGDDNVVSTSQLGDLNTANINILGSSNIVGVEQNGNSQSATVLQTGDSNFTKVVQHF